jgi:hypothetical protein
MKKIRGDAAEHKLPPQAREELAALVNANAPLKQIQALFDRHGVDLSLQGAARAHHRVKAAADRLLARSATLHALRKLAEKQGITLTGAALEQATVAVGDLLDASVDPGSEEGQQLLLKGLTALTGARSVEIQAERVGVAKGALSVAERRLKLLEENAASAKAKLTAVASKGGLTPETLKQIEEAAKLL